jgi:hypothetical protein
MALIADRRLGARHPTLSSRNGITIVSTVALPQA